MSKCIICGRELTTSEPLEMYNGMCAKCYWNRHYSSIITNIDDETVICGSLGTFKMLSIEEYNKLQDQINQLKQQLAEKDKEIERLKDFIGCKGCVDVIKKSNDNQTQLAIQELEKVNGILTDTIIEVTQNEMDLNKLCYLEEISARFYEKMQGQIKLLKGEKDEV